MPQNAPFVPTRSWNWILVASVVGSLMFFCFFTMTAHAVTVEPWLANLINESVRGRGNKFEWVFVIFWRNILGFLGNFGPRLMYEICTDSKNLGFFGS